MCLYSGCGCKEVYRLDFLILLIPTPIVSALFCSSIPPFCSLKKKVFRFLYISFDSVRFVHVPSLCPFILSFLCLLFSDHQPV